MKEILVVGCSYASGWKLAGESQSPDLWINALYPGDKITNLSKPGANNHWIFLRTAQALRQTKFDQVIVAWTAIPRYHFRVGLELYCTDTKLTAEREINVVGGENVTRYWQETVGDQLRKIHNDHWDILDLVHYVNILINLCPDIVFVNSLLPWSQNYFDHNVNAKVADLDTYTKKLLQADQRDDEETLKLYHHIHQQYHQAGSIQQHHWLNLYDSFDQLKIDRIDKHDSHPAVASHRHFAEHLRKILCAQPN